MLRKRIIPTLLLEQQSLIKTINFKEKTYVGDPLNAIKIFNEKFVDELIILDINQNKKKNEIDYNFLKDLFSECFVPVTYGGGINNVRQADKLLNLGVEKICLNSIVLENKQIVKERCKPGPSAASGFKWISWRNYCLKLGLELFLSFL